MSDNEKLRGQVPRKPRKSGRSDKAQSPPIATRKYNDSAPTLEVAKNLADPTSPTSAVAYSSPADLASTRAFDSELAARIAGLRAGRQIGALGIFFDPLPVLVGSGREIDLKAGRKAQRGVAKAFPHYVSRIINAAYLANDNTESFNIRLVIVTLGFHPADSQRSFTPSIGRSVAALPQSLWVDEPDEAFVKQLCSTFADATAIVRRAAGEAAVLQDANKWIACRDARQLMLWQADLLTPFKKTLVAKGLGSAILTHAMTGPEARAKAAKKLDGKTHPEIVNMLWQEARADDSLAPPFVRF